MLVLIVPGLTMWGWVGTGWSREQTEGGCVLVIRQAKECVEKRFIGDSSLYRMLLLVIVH